MDGLDESRQTYEHFRAIGERHAVDVYRCWQEREFPQALWDELGCEGVLAAATSRGRGIEAGALFLAPVFQGVTNATLDGGFMISVAVHGVFGLGLIDRCPSEAVRDRYLDRLCSGKEMLAFAVTEPHGGTDALNPETSATRYSSDLVKVSGRKWHITNAPMAAVILALAKDDKGRLVLAIVDRDLDGVSVGEALAPAGARTSPVAEIVFQDVLVPSENVFQPTGGVGNALRKVLTAEKILGAYPAIGMMERVTTESIAFARSRSANGRPLVRQQFVQYRLTEMQIALETIRASRGNAGAICTGRGCHARGSRTQAPGHANGCRNRDQCDSSLRELWVAGAIAAADGDARWVERDDRRGYRRGPADDHRDGDDETAESRAAGSRHGTTNLLNHVTFSAVARFARFPSCRRSRARPAIRRGRCCRDRRSRRCCPAIPRAIRRRSGRGIAGRYPWLREGP